MLKRVLVTGVNGFVGHHLVDELLRQGFEVAGAGRELEIKEPLMAKLEAYTQCDLANMEDVRKLPLHEVQGVINLAGLAAVGPSFDQPELYMRVNTGVLDNLCKVAIEQELRGIRIIAVSSGAVYEAHQELPLTELSDLDADSSPYAKSKIAMEDLALAYREQGLDCVVARPFNHIGPGQAAGFLLPDLYDKVNAATADSKPLLVGNLQTKRDYTDVRDVVKAYVSLVSAPSLDEGIFNVCSGKARSGEEILALLLKELGAQDLVPKVDESQFRPSDSPELYGDSARLRNATGWSPAIQIEQTIEDFVNWRKNL